MPVEHQDNTPEEAAEIKHKRETEKQRMTRIDRAWKAVMADPDGRAVIWHILSTGGLLQPTFVKGEPDQSIYNQGKREFVLGIYRAVQTDHPRGFLDMHKENAG
jgi:hypothetical protein